MSFLPGTFPVGATANGVLSQVTQVLSATALSNQITIPVGTRKGDLIVLIDSGSTAFQTPSSAVVPTGFTAVSNSAGSTVRDIFSYKLAVGSESGSVITGMSGSFVLSKSMYVFRGNVPIKTATHSGLVFGHSDSAQGNRTILASGAASTPVLVVAAYAAAGVVSPRSFTPAPDGELSASVNQFLLYKSFDSAPLDVVISMQDEGSSNYNAGFFFTFT